MATYKIKSGDTLSAIAARFGTTVSALASANNIANPDRIFAGRTLTIPGGSGSSGPKLNSDEAHEMASLAGFSVAFFKSNNELERIFKKALDEDWSGQRLLAAARNTNWFKNHSESARRVQLLKTSDPAEYRRQRTQTRDAVRNIIRELGVPVKGFSINAVADLALAGGWNESQIIRHVTSFKSVIDAVKSGRSLKGKAADAERGIRELAAAYGINASNNFVANNTQKIVRGLRDENFYREYFLNQAKSTYAGLRAELEAGMTVAEIAEPYIDSMARVLEVNPADINVFDQQVRKALISRDKDGKPAAKTLWQFEEDLKKDSRWMKTNNAREELMAAGRQVLRDFGVTF